MNSLHYLVPEELLAMKAPPLPPVKPVKQWTPDPETELINPWRYWTLEGHPQGLEKEIHADISADGSAGQRIIRVTGDFGRGSSLRYSLGKGIKLGCGRYSLAFCVRGTPGQSVDLELADSVDYQLADDSTSVVKRASIPLTAQWQEHSLEFEISTTFENQTFLRFRLPNEVRGIFDLKDIRMKTAK